jgi:hypothetical protein
LILRHLSFPIENPFGLDTLTFLSSYVCHNTDFSVLQQPESAGCSSFVRACNDCIAGHGGCGCGATSFSGGFATDRNSVALGVLVALAASLAAVAVTYAGESVAGGEEEGRQLLGRRGNTRAGLVATSTLWRVALWLSLAARAALVVALALVSPGEPHTQEIASSTDYAWWTLVPGASAVLVALALACYREGAWPGVVAGYVCVCDLVLVAWWAAPSVAVVTEAATAHATGTLVLGAATLCVVVVERLVLSLRVGGGWCPLLIVLALAARVLLFLRLPCE